MNSSNFIFTCPGTTDDAPDSDSEAKAIARAYQVQVRVADGERAAVLIDGTTRRWEDNDAAQTILRQIWSSQPVFGLHLRLPPSLFFATLPDNTRVVQIDDGGMAAIFKKQTTNPGVTQTTSNDHNKSSENDSVVKEEYEIDEYLEDEFSETQPY